MLPDLRPSPVAEQPDGAPPRATLNNLQAMRALAALLVVYLHFSTSRHVDLDPLFGLYGVHMFFVISGFIIAHSAGHDARDFLARRLIRIVPMYWAVTALWLGAIIAAPSISDSTPTVARVLRSLFFVPDDPILYRGWTLNYEMYFYVVFAVSIAISRRRAPLLCAGIIAATTTIVALVRPTGAIAFYGNPIVLLFLAGVATYWLWRKAQASATCVRLVRVWRWPLVGLLFGALVSAAVAESAERTPTVLWLGVPSIAVVLLGVLLEQCGGLQQRSRLLLRLGDASYVMYLIHPFVILPLQRFAFPHADQYPTGVKLLLFAGSACVVCVVSVAVHRLVEKPVQRLLTSAWRSKAGGAVTERAGAR